MQPGRSRKAIPDDKPTSARWMLFVLLALLLLGGAYVFMTIQTFVFKSKLDAALSEKVITSNQYAELSEANVHKRIKLVENQLKLHQMQAFVTIQPRDEFNEIGQYYLQGELLGHNNAQSNRSTKIPGCSSVDALPPGTTLKNLSASTAAGQGNMMNRVGAAAANDGKAMLTGDAPTTSAPTGSLVFAIDVVFTFRYLFFKRKMWFHRRCYFYGKRRVHLTTNQINKALKAQ